MKLFKSMILCSVGALMTLFSGCSDWLDVNVDPENPTAGNATYDSRLAHIEFYTNSATQFAAWRSSMSMGDWTRYYDGGTYWNMSYWSPQYRCRYHSLPMVVLWSCCKYSIFD